MGYAGAATFNGVPGVPHLDTGSVQLVDMIARVRVGEDKQRNYLSFASKYCTWHRPKSYPIYDSRAEKCLWAYKLQFGLRFARKDLWEYSGFAGPQCQRLAVMVGHWESGSGDGVISGYR